MLFDANVGDLLTAKSVQWGSNATVASDVMYNAGAMCCRVDTLNSTSFLASVQTTTSNGVTLRVGSVATNGTVTFGNSITNIADVQEWDVCVLSATKVAIAYVVGATLTVKTYTISSVTTLTLDATATYTVGNYTTNRTALVALSATRAFVSFVSGGSSSMYVVGITFGSGTAAFDASASSVITTNALDNAPPSLLYLTSTTFACIYQDGNMTARVVTDNGSGSAPSLAGTATISSTGGSADINIPRIDALLVNGGTDLYIAGCSSTSGYGNEARLAAISGTTITAPTDSSADTWWGLPWRVHGASVVSSASDTSVAILAMSSGRNMKAGILLTEIANSEDFMRYGYPIEKSDSLVAGSNDANAADVCMLSSTRGVLIYPITSTQYPTVAVFDL